MVVIVTYIAAAMLLAPSIFVAAEWIGHDHPPRPAHRVAYSVLAAALWPVLVVGLVQFAAIVAVRRILVSRASRSTGPVLEQFGAEADTAQLPRLAVPYVRAGTV